MYYKLPLPAELSSLCVIVYSTVMHLNKYDTDMYTERGEWRKGGGRERSGERDGGGFLHPSTSSKEFA